MVMISSDNMRMVMGAGTGASQMRKVVMVVS